MREWDREGGVSEREEGWIHPTGVWGKGEGGIWKGEWGMGNGVGLGRRGRIPGVQELTPSFLTSSLSGRRILLLLFLLLNILDILPRSPCVQGKGEVM